MEQFLGAKEIFSKRLHYCHGPKRLFQVLRQHFKDKLLRITVLCFFSKSNNSRWQICHCPVLPAPLVSVFKSAGSNETDGVSVRLASENRSPVSSNSSPASESEGDSRIRRMC